VFVIRNAKNKITNSKLKKLVAIQKKNFTVKITDRERVVLHFVKKLAVGPENSSMKMPIVLPLAS
jgi:hypothetical protein